MKTKGALIWGPQQDWSIEEIEVGAPRSGEVMVKFTASGLCHSDYHLNTGAVPIAYPAIGGHEGAGVVIEVGPNVEGLEVGDHVVTSFVPACGRCVPCSEGNSQICDFGADALTGKSISDGTVRVQVRGQDVAPFCLLGSFSPYATVHRASVVKIDKSIPLEIAALVGCGVCTGWGSATNAAGVRPGDTVVIMGTGGVGMNAVQGARAAGAARVIVIEPVEAKRKWALETFGATHAFADYDEAFAQIQDLTAGIMAKSVIITVGEATGEDIWNALSLTAKNGRTVLTSMASADLNEVSMSPFELTAMQKELRGALFGMCRPASDIPRLLDLYKTGQLNLDDLVTRTYRLEQINEAYQDMMDGKNIRGVIVYNDDDYETGE